MPWPRAFEDPITLPDGRTLSTLRDAASYLMALPGKTRQSDEWQAAVEALIMAAEGRGPVMHSRIGVLRALNRNIERVFTDRKEMHWGSGSWRGTDDRAHSDRNDYRIRAYRSRSGRAACCSDAISRAKLRSLGARMRKA